MAVNFAQAAGPAARARADKRGVTRCSRASNVRANVGLYSNSGHIAATPPMTQRANERHQVLTRSPRRREPGMIPAL